MRGDHRTFHVPRPLVRPTPPDDARPADVQDSGERLQKVLAAAGVASRRAAEQLIAQGRVRVDGAVVTTAGQRVNPQAQTIEVDGQRIGPLSSVTFRYVALHKPVGYVTTMSDPQGRPSLTHLLPLDELGRVYPVGRLDYDSEGLLILTNDGELTFRLTHPRYSAEKEYLAAVATRPSDLLLSKLSQGVDLDGALTAQAVYEHDVDWYGYPAIRIVLHEGRHRQIRRLFEQEGVRVVRLIRTRVGPVELGRLRAGQWRHLDAWEVGGLHQSVGLKTR